MATSLVLLPALALTAACGAKKPDTPAQRLVHAMLGSKDVPQVKAVPSTASNQLLGDAQKADKAECQPMADQWSTKPSRHTPQVYTGGVLTDTAATDPNAKEITLEVLATYKPGEARQVLDALTSALRACHGYTTVRNGTTTHFTVVAHPASGAPLGDQQVSYSVTDPALGAQGTVLVTVVRVGDSTAAYETVRADHRTAVLRPAIPLKQSAKLREQESR
ncbi:sensor domain-containing protein [Actinacidiphila yeochonensis]|uniref:sensor domain-containing protein n=1 Tax=Actinacidiphila yeochonensis TaxID=89050 RepID=UPI000565C66C|nr:sensor domain-containing protein [Actinacidiphila yeochonensis]